MIGQAGPRGDPLGHLDCRLRRLVEGTERVDDEEVVAGLTRKALVEVRDHGRAQVAAPDVEDHRAVLPVEARVDLRRQRRQVGVLHPRDAGHDADPLALEFVRLLAGAEVQVDDVEVHQRDVHVPVLAQAQREVDGNLGLAGPEGPADHGEATPLSH